MRKLIVANWKMNGDTAIASDFVSKLNNINAREIVLCLPYPYLYLAANKNFSVGGQDCSTQKQGAYTGDISAAMLHDIGCKYVIVGHSERRSYHHETNQMIKEKVKVALQSKVTPIVCVGEKKQGEDIEDLFQQCNESVYDNCIIAYEPVWAIGTGLTPTNDEINEVTTQLQHKYSLPILYGGSINQNNATDIITIPSVSGLLIGGASLDFNVFAKIVNNVVTINKM